MLNLYLGIVNFKFDSLDQLKENFNCLRDLISKMKAAKQQTLYLRLHWQQHTLRKEYQALAIESIQDLKKQYERLNILTFMPQCFDDSLKLANFPHCNTCIYSEAFICKWPWQMKCEYVSEPQRDFETIDLDNITPEAFQTRSPLTWIMPYRRHIELCAQILSNVDWALDFGCGNGFIDYLILNEAAGNNRIYGFDPYHPPKIKHSKFTSIDSMADLDCHKASSWAAISALGDYNVPVEDVFRLNKKPDIFVLFQFPDVFGGGGEKFEWEVNNGTVTRQNSKEIFSLESLDAEYELILNEPVKSLYYENSCFKIYVSRTFSLELDLSRTPISYSWENILSDKKESISTDCLL